eukprot:GHVP01056798.1.p1 GENE.GHVP01056798.1~~GHVP01056798.1.p1  ORF type:complete len:191 (-),score=21.88 GHVP01056798.1:263-793(-)
MTEKISSINTNFNTKLVQNYYWNGSRPLKLLQTNNYFLFQKIPQTSVFAWIWRHIKPALLTSEKGTLRVIHKRQFRKELENFNEIWYFNGLFVDDKSLVSKEIQDVFGQSRYEDMQPEQIYLVLSTKNTPDDILKIAKMAFLKKESFGLQIFQAEFLQDVTTKGSSTNCLIWMPGR